MLNKLKEKLFSREQKLRDLVDLHKDSVERNKEAQKALLSACERNACSLMSRTTEPARGFIRIVR